MFHCVDQDLRVHHEGSIATEGDAVTRLLRQGGRKQRAGRKAHVGGAGFGEGIAGAIVFHDLKAIGLHIAGIEELGCTDFFGEIGDDLNCRRLGQDWPLPRFVAQRRAFEALALVSRPLRFFSVQARSQSFLLALVFDFSDFTARRLATAEMSPINASVLL